MADVTTFVASGDNVDDILTVTNDAYMADAFFKKPEYHLRFDRQNVIDMIADPNGQFILARSDDGVCGSVYLQTSSSVTESVLKVSGSFSAVAVPSKYGKRGIGGTLIKAVEARIREVAAEQHSLHQHLKLEVLSEMGVINVREDLFPWYGKQGYERLHEIRPNNAELTRIILDGMDVCCVQMRKRLM